MSLLRLPPVPLPDSPQGIGTQLPERPLEFRPAPGLRWLCLAFGLLSGMAACGLIVSALMQGEMRRIPPALVVGLPCLLSAVILRRRLLVTEAGLRSIALLHDFTVPWGAVRHLDQTRSSFQVATDLGIISAGLISVGDRERLLRLILEKARLTSSGKPLRMGLTARYIPRQKDLKLAEFKPHNRRSKPSPAPAYEAEDQGKQSAAEGGQRAEGEGA